MLTLGVALARNKSEKTPYPVCREGVRGAGREGCDRCAGLGRKAALASLSAEWLTCGETQESCPSRLP